MNVILDASPLGMGFYHRQARTGVSRVIEQLVNGLHCAPELDLMLAAPTHIAETMRYTQSTFSKNTPVFANTPGEQRIAQLENSLLRHFSPESKPTKAIRQVTYQTRRAFNREASSFDPANWPGQSVYHATFFPIPEAVRQNRAIPVVQSIYDMIAVYHPHWFTAGEQTLKKVLATLPPHAWVTAVSQATKDEFCAYTGFDASRVVPILLAASPALFYPVTDLSRQQAARTKFGIGDNPYLLSIATLEPRKNLAHLIRSFAQLIDANELPSDVRLVLVGLKGWKFDEILAEASKNPAVAARLIFTGFVNDEDLAPLYSGAMAFIYPSLYEGFGLPTLEAMQCGLPVITANIPAIAEVVGKAAIQVAPTDADALCQAITTVVKSSSLRAGLAAQGLQQATRFGWDLFIQDHITLYKNLLNK